MAKRFQEKNFLVNWLKALILSPGVLFPTAYLLVYFSTNIYLDSDYKKNLTQSIIKATGHTLLVQIASVKSDLTFDSVTLREIELTPMDFRKKNKQNNCDKVTISALEIQCPDLDKLLLSTNGRLLSTETICNKILAEKHVLSLIQ